MCQILVERVVGTDYNATLGRFDSINVVGTVEGCPSSFTDATGQWAQLEVKVITDTGFTQIELVPVLTHGSLDEEFDWTAYIKGIPCGGVATVTVRCLGEDDCVVEFEGEMLCDVSLCPAVTFEVSDGGCVDGERQISIVATVQGSPLNQMVIWRYGDDNDDFSQLSNSNVTTVVLSYRPQDLDHPEVTFVLDPDCEYPVEMPRSLLRGCDVECPTVEFTSIEDGGCDAEGNRVIQITAEYTGSPIEGYVIWHYGAGRQANSYVGGEDEIVAELPYSAADLEEQGVTLELSPDCLYDLTIPRKMLIACPAACPSVEFTSIEDGGCDAEGNRIIVITAEYTEPAIVDDYVIWHYGAGRQASSYVDGDLEIEVELPYGPSDLDERDVTLEISPECTYDVRIPRNLLTECPPVPDEEEEDDEDNGHDEDEEEDEEEHDHQGGSCFCIAWLILNLILTIAAGIAIIVAACAPNPVSIGIAVGLALACLVSWFFFWLICLMAEGDCDLARWASFLLNMLASLMAVVAIVWGIVTVVAELTIGCFIGSLITLGYYALLALWFQTTVLLMGCYNNSSYWPWED